MSIDQTKPTMRSYLAAASDLECGKQTPRQLAKTRLRSLINGSRGSALLCAPMCNARLRGRRSDQPNAGAPASRRRRSRRHAGGHQGHYRDGRHADRNGLAFVRRLALAEGCRVCAGAARSAGAVIVGKTVTTEFAATQPRGTRNTVEYETYAGGSSSGSGRPPWRSKSSAPHSGPKSSARR